ncbi:hypothetical protein HOLleu_21002 [Holothuria leucospilota]|uniref:Uncharacterized protein n=1 Tax=Holothuria leucospilota TaxID=206669 RepID=A0A9Q1H6I3_HOLLE|nr:hypothetical protein HOLleu_21002 [Holothuria leucospilota]
MIKDLKWVDSLKTRRLRARLVVIYKETHGLLPSNVVDHLIDPSNPNRRTSSRTSGRYLHHHPSTNKLCYQKSLKKSLNHGHVLLRAQKRTGPDGVKHVSCRQPKYPILTPPSPQKH